MTIEQLHAEYHSDDPQPAATLTEADIRIIKNVVHEILQKHQQCRFQLDETQVRNIEAFAGMMQEVGGTSGAGLSVMRENHVWIKKTRERSEKVSTVLLVLLVTSVVSGAIAAFWSGLKQHMTGQ